MAMLALMVSTSAHADDSAKAPAEKCVLSPEKLKATRLEVARQTLVAVALFPSRWGERGPAVDDDGWEQMRSAFRGVTETAQGIAPCLTKEEQPEFAVLLEMYGRMAAESRTEWMAKAKENGGKIADRVGPTMLSMTIVKIKAQNYLDDQMPAFVASWTLKGGTFTMRAGSSSEWQGKLHTLGLGDRYVPLRVEMKNGSSRDIEFNPLVDRFVVVTREGKQFNTIALAADFELHQALAPLPEEDQQLLFTQVRTLYSGSEQPMIVLLPSAAAPENWRAAVYESAMGAAGGSLPTMKFKPAPPKVRTQKPNATSPRTAP
jgi:hypothetical protein